MSGITITLTTALSLLGLAIAFFYMKKVTSIPLDKVNAGRWKRDIPAREWEMAEPFLREFIEAYGYATD